MKNYRKIKNIHTAPEVEMGDIKLRQAFPLSGLEQISPFILLHHFDFTRPAGEHDFNVPPHPHRGFSPITFMYEGAVEHKDSLGNNHVIGDNEVQWINAARGIIHGEKVGKEFAEKGGRFQGIQLWINTPASKKMAPPSYQPITKEEIVLIEKDGVEFRLVSGKYRDKKGPADSDVFTAMMHMKAKSDFEISFPATHNVAFYILEGSVRINETELASQYGLVQFENTDGEIRLEALKDSKLLLMAGEPIHEPLVTHGPFVMNSQTEILEAMRDYQQGKMGFLY
jgi:redox-sensitive bicupin YhaK (pirin superfamily)